MLYNDAASKMAALIVFMAVALGGSRVHAQPAAAAYGVPSGDFTLAWQLGGFISTQTNGALTGLTGLARWRFLEAGLLLQTGGKVLRDNASSAAVAAGLSWPSANRVRLDLLVVVGARYYTAVGQEILDDDPGTRATVGYAGAIWGVSYLVSKPLWPHSLFGLWLSFEEDLTRVTRQYTYVDHPGILANVIGVHEPTHVTRTRVIGATRTALVFTIGAVFDL